MDLSTLPTEKVIEIAIKTSWFRNWGSVVNQALFKKIRATLFRRKFDGINSQPYKSMAEYRDYQQRFDTEFSKKITELSNTEIQDKRSEEKGNIHHTGEFRGGEHHSRTGF